MPSAAESNRIKLLLRPYSRQTPGLTLERLEGNAAKASIDKCAGGGTHTIRSTCRIHSISTMPPCPSSELPRRSQFLRRDCVVMSLSSLCAGKVRSQ